MRRLRSKLVGILVASVLTGASVATLGAVTTAPAQAACTTGLNDDDCDGDGIPNRFETDSWWSSKGTTSDGNSDYTYVSFPSACTPATASFVHRALWIYDDTTTVVDRRSTVRDIIAAANSEYAASAKEVYTTQAQLAAGHWPKWQTNATTCLPVITNVAVPHATYTSLMAGDVDTFWAWMNANGYNQPGVKYVEFVQDYWNVAHCGLSSGAGYQNNHPGLDNGINHTSHSTLPVSGTTQWTGDGGCLAHEMTHNLGAMYTDQPHYNASNPQGHASDCGDRMCYSDQSTPGQVYNIGCGGFDAYGFPTATFEKSMQRLDCNDDDYWSIGNAAAWTATRYNLWSSPYLHAYSGSLIPNG